MRKQTKITGFTLIELLVTMSIMLIFGSTGMMQISHLKNYFVVQGSQEKLQSAIQNTKKDILEGLAQCGKIQAYAEDTSPNQSTFFIVEEWTPLETSNKCKGTNQFTNFVSEVQVSSDFQVQLALNKEDLNIQAFDANFQEIQVQTSGKSVFFPLTQSEIYNVKIYSEDQTPLSTLEIAFYNANKSSIENNDPSIIRIEKVSGKIMSQSTFNGNLTILFEAPYAKSRLTISDTDHEYLAKDIQIFFINANDAAGSYDFFNAALLPLKRGTPKLAVRKTTCAFDENDLKFSCF